MMNKWAKFNNQERYIFFKTNSKVSSQSWIIIIKCFKIVGKLVGFQNSNVFKMKICKNVHSLLIKIRIFKIQKTK
jgi:hypothetical protein